MLDFLICTFIMLCFMHALCSIFCLLRIWSLLTVQPLHHLNYLWDLSPWLVTLECFDVLELLKIGQLQWMASLRINSKGTQRGIRKIHLGFSPTQKGLLLYVPSTRQIIISGDVICDETFASTVAETWRPFHDALALRPTASFIPDSWPVKAFYV